MLADFSQKFLGRGAVIIETNCWLIVPRLGAMREIRTSWMAAKLYNPGFDIDSALGGHFDEDPFLNHN